MLPLSKTILLLIAVKFRKKKNSSHTMCVSFGFSAQAKCWNLKDKKSVKHRANSTEWRVSSLEWVFLSSISYVDSKILTMNSIYLWLSTTGNETHRRRFNSIQFHLFHCVVQNFCLNKILNCFITILLFSSSLSFSPSLLWTRKCILATIHDF